MTTYTFYADVWDGYINSSNATYATARSGAGTLSVPFTFTVYVGQQLSGGVYYCFEGFISFNTSSIGAAAPVSSATLTCYFQNSSADASFTLNARAHNWGAGLTTGDYIAGASLSADQLLASIAVTSGSPPTGSQALTSDAAFPAGINTSGTTYLVLSSSLHQANTAPTGNEYIGFASDENGTSKAPKLTVIAALPISGDAAVTDAADTLVSAGTVAIAGAVAVTDAADTLASAVLTATPGSIKVKYNGAWQIPTPWVKRNGSWVQPVAGYVNQSGTWKRVL